MLLERSATEPERQVRFSSLPPSTPLLTFDVLEWSPEEHTGAGPLARLQAWRASVDRHSESHASVASSEELVDRRDRTAFGDALGSWTCFRALSCCGDRLVLEDAAMVDAGPARRGDFTWQLGPGRLSATGAHQDWRQVLAAAASDGGNTSVADVMARDTLISSERRGKKPSAPATSPIKREIQMQDIHSIRRHCFQSPVPLVFDAHGREVPDEHKNHGKRPAQQRSGHHSNGKSAVGAAASRSAKTADALRWRYELWGPVGLIFTLRGGHRLYLAFASAQQTEQIEELLTDFASGVGLTRRLRNRVLSPRLNHSGSFAAVQNWSSGDGMPAPGSPTVTSVSAVAGAVASALEAGGGSLAERLSQSRAQRTPSVSVLSPRLASGEASFQAAASPPITPCAPSNVASVSTFSAAQPPRTPVSPGGVLFEVPRPLASPTRRRTSAATAPDAAPSTPWARNLPQSVVAARATAEAVSRVGQPPLQRSHSSVRAPGSGYLYCRPWAEMGKKRRYYVKLSARAGTHYLLHLSRHRLQLWQRLHHALGHEPRAVSLDLRRTTVTASATNEVLLQVSSVVDSFAQYRDVEPLGGGVALAGPANESAAVRAMRRRETELCTGRPVFFEALAKSPADRAAWLSWLRGVGAAVVEPVAATEPAATSNPKVHAMPSFTPLGGEQFVALFPLRAPTLSGGLGSGTAEQWTHADAAPISSLETSSMPNLPLQERPEGRRGGPLSDDSASISRVKSGAGLPARLLSCGSTSSAAFPSPLNPHLCRRESDAEAELSIVVEDDERNGLRGSALPVDPPSPQKLKRSDPSFINATVPPSRRSSASPISGDGSRLHLTSGSRLHICVPPSTKPAATAPVPLNGRLKSAALAEQTLVVAATTQRYLDDTTSSTASSVHSARVASPSPGKETLTATAPGAPPSQPPSASSPQSATPSTRDPTPREHGGAATSALAVATAATATPRLSMSPTPAPGQQQSGPVSPGTPRRPRSPRYVSAPREPASAPPGEALLHSGSSDMSEASARHSSEEAAAALAAMESLMARLSQCEEPQQEPRDDASRRATPKAPLESAPVQALRDGSAAEPRSPAVRGGPVARHADPSNATVRSPMTRPMHDTSSASASAASPAGHQLDPHGAKEATSSSVSSAPSPSSGSPPTPHLPGAVDARLEPFLAAAHEQRSPTHVNSSAANGEAMHGRSGSRRIELSSSASQNAAPRDFAAVLVDASTPLEVPRTAVGTSTPYVVLGSPSLRDGVRVSPPQLSDASAATLFSGGGTFSRAAQGVRGHSLQPSSSSTPQHTPSSSSRASLRGSELKGSLRSPPSLDLIEQRRRAFRESLFIHQNEA